MNNYARPYGQNGIQLGYGTEQILIALGGQYDKDRRSKKHQREYTAFPLINPIPGAAIVGVANEEFVVAFKAKFTERYAVAVYVDGTNVEQRNGIKSLSEIPEFLRENYDRHQCFIATSDYVGDTNYLDRFNQVSGQNRLLTFTLDETKGVNYNTISDPSQMSRIEVYVWKERPYIRPQNDDFGLESTRSMGTKGGTTRSAVGAGQATNQQSGSTTGLNNPIFIGKATFVHVPYTAVRHLGDRFVYANQPVSTPTPNLTFRDPMDLVPKSGSQQPA